MLPSAHLDALARWVADSSEIHAGGAAQEIACPIRYRFSDLSEPQKAALRTYVDEAQLKGVEGLDAAVVSFRMQRWIKLAVSLPNGKRFGDYVAAYDVRADETEALFHEALLHQLCQLSTPAGALLGASLKEQLLKDTVSGLERRVGVVLPAVRMEAADKSLQIPPLPAGLLYREFLPLLADRAGLGIISDHFTLSRRAIPGKTLPKPGAHSLRSVLEGVSGTYQTALRYDGDYLLGRNTFWPDRDEEEVPHPQPDAWLEAKRTTGILPLQEILQIGRLSEPQQNGLAAYNDGTASLRKEVQYVRQNRGLLGVLSKLSPAQLEALGGQGLPVGTLTQQAREILSQEFRRSPGGDAVHPQDMGRAVLWLSPPAGGSLSRSIYALVDNQPFWESQLPFDVVRRRR